MFRATTLTSAALVASALAVPLVPTPATGVGETCHGRAATVVGAPGVKVTGTVGDDVIVAPSPRIVRALGGNDLVCVTEGHGWVDAGEGDDVVDASAAAGVTAVLGTGADRFTGSSGVDHVYTGGGSGDLDVDVVDTGPAGEVDDFVGSGTSGNPNSDVVTMGLGTLQWTGLATSAAVVEGGGTSRLQLHAASSSEAVTVDAVSQEASVGTGTSLRFHGFTRYLLTSSLQSAQRIEFRGSGESEVLEIDPARIPRGADQSMDLGGGRDRVLLRGAGTVLQGLRIDGGADRDLVEVVWVDDDSSAALDLGRGRLVITRAGRAGRASVVGFEDADVRAKGVVLLGSGVSNHLSANACRLQAAGRGGDDLLTWKDWRQNEELMCQPRGVELEGGSGRDVLRGSPLADHLLGGAGKDVAWGRAGRDECSAEVTRQCEVRR